MIFAGFTSESWQAKAFYPALKKVAGNRMITLLDMLIRVKNAQMNKKERVLVSFSKANLEVAKILKNKNFIQDFERKKKKIKKTEHPFLEIKLNSGKQKPAIAGLKIVSKPSRRFYIKKEEIKPVVSGYGISIISTSKGIMTGEEAKKSNLGGELLAEVW